MPIPIISMITDFGQGHHFVGSMRGVILSINPEVIFMDITHDIKPFDVLEASYILQAVANHAPTPTIFLIVVDPGVGSSRRPILAVGEKHYYVSPDNGVITRVLKDDSITQVYEVTETHYFRKSECATFHGRDIFAPVAAWLSKFFRAAMFGDAIEDYQVLDIPKPAIIQDKTLKCQVLFVDRFGNLITNFERSMLDVAAEKFGSKDLKLKAGNSMINGLKTHYLESETRDEPIALFGSMDLLEVAIRENNASNVLGIKPGDPIFIQFG